MCDPRRYRELIGVVSAKKTPRIRNDFHGVGINGVGVEHIELHLTYDLAELGQVARKDAVPQHAPQLFCHPELAFQHFSEELTMEFIISVVIVNQLRRLSQ